MNILSINTGRITQLLPPNEEQGKSIYSAINKITVSNPSQSRALFVDYAGLGDDEQANKTVHGGPNKALYAYPFEHYPFWRNLLTNQLGRDVNLEWGAFGENLTVQGFDESQVLIGDYWQVGGVLLEVVQFRQPCFKFNIKMDWSGASKAMIQTQKCGWYLKVHKTGEISSGDTVDVIRSPDLLSVAQQCKNYYQTQSQPDLWSS
jgi:MOSC domain-containing protein YiiM